MQRAMGDTKKEADSTVQNITSVLSANDAAEIPDRARSTTQRKSEKLLRKKQPSVSQTSLVDKANWVINLSSRTLSEAEVSLLKKGLNFTLTPAIVQAKEVIAKV